MHALTIELHALGDRAHRVDVQTGVRLVEDGKLRLEHEHLQDLRFLFLTAGKAHIQVALSIGSVHRQQLHRLGKILLEVPEADALAGLLLERTADKRAERHAGHLERILKRQKNTPLRALVDRQPCDILAVKDDLSGRDRVLRIAGDRIAERGLAGAVRPHEHMRLILADGQVHAVQDLFLARTHVQAADFKQVAVHICILRSQWQTVPDGTAAYAYTNSERLRMVRHKILPHRDELYAYIPMLSIGI